MRNLIFILSLVCVLCSSCTYQYQIFDTTSTTVTEYGDDVFLYESENIDIYYDLWIEGGVVIFNIINKTDQDIVIVIDSCQFQLNGVRFPYSSYNIPGLEEYAELYKWSADTGVKIPPGKTFQIEGYPINFNWVRFRKKTRIRDFDKDNSPLKFANSISYHFESDPNEVISVNNKFWVSEVRRLKYSEFKQWLESEEGNKADKFYLNRETSDFGAEVWLDLTASLIEAILFF